MFAVASLTEHVTTTLRLLTPLIAGSKIQAKITGDKSLSKRPYRLEFLKKFLMNLKPTRKKYLPIQINGHESCIQSKVKITKPSAQMVSAATIAGMVSYGETEIEAPNNVRDHTTRILRYLAYPIKVQNRKNIYYNSAFTPHIPLSISLCLF